MENNILKLREQLFNALDRLSYAKTKEQVDLEVDKAASIVHISDAILRSAELENEYLHIAQKVDSTFISPKEIKEQNKLEEPIFNHETQVDAEDINETTELLNRAHYHRMDSDDSIPEDEHGNYLTEEKRGKKFK